MIEMFFTNEWILVALTFLLYFTAQYLQRRTGLIILNPILVTVILMIAILMLFNVDYHSYHKGARYIEFFLKPAIVALGVPLYLQLEKIKKQAVIILLSQLLGCIIGIVSVVGIAWALGASKDVIISLAPKSATTPIAMEITEITGGITAITIAVVIVVGMFGAVFGYSILKWARIKNPIAQSLAIGHISHAVGTARSMEISPNYGAMSSIGLIVNGIFTAILTPYILKLFAIWM